MKPSSVEIVDVTTNNLLERLLYKCLAPMPFRRYRRRREYLERAIPKGFRKKVLTINGEVVGTIEYGPPEASGYPIKGEDVIAMNCVWVLRKVKGHHLGMYLMKDMMENNRDASGFATIGLENHWSPWLKKGQLERLGFKSIDSIKVAHKTKRDEEAFKIHLMWLQTKEDAKPPTWDRHKILEGVHFCLAHPLYHPERLGMKQILQEL